MHPDLPDFRASLDQFSASLRDVAHVFADYYDALLERGFKEEQALELTVSCQETVLGALMGQPDDDG